ncbi:MAG: ribosome biogenesis factor YjgA [Ideonella sp.]
MPLPSPREPTDEDAPATEPARAPGVDASFANRPSKTRRKQAAHDLQALGEALAGMPDKRLDGLDMPEILRDAIRAYNRTRTHEARRRQMQYIGKLMHRADPEPLREAVAAMQLGHARDSLALHEAEHWRAALVADDEAATRWALAHPDSELQQLRSLVRAARKDAAATPEKRSGKAFRDLFRFIRSHESDETHDV